MGWLDDMTTAANDMTLTLFSHMTTLAFDPDAIPGTPGGPAPACGHGLDCLPVLRWANQAGSLTSRNDGILGNWNPMSWVNNIQANLTGMLTGAGNGLWSAAAWMSNGAEPDAALAKFGPMANRVAGQVYGALFDPSSVGFFIAIPMLLVMVIGFCAAYTRQGWKVFFKRFAALCVGFGLFFAMGATSAAHPDSDYPATPYWMASTAFKIVNTAGDGVTKQFNKTLIKTGRFVAFDGSWDRLSCRRYTAWLNTEGAKGKDALADSVNLMWEETGLRIWMRSAYGSGDNASQVFCRVLEYRAGAAPSDQAQIVNQASGGAATAAGWAPAFWPSLMTTKETLTADTSKNDPSDTSDQMIDRYVMTWNACGMKPDGSYRIRPGFDFIGALKKKPVGGAAVAGAKNRGAGGSSVSSCMAMITGFDTPSGGTQYQAVDGPGDWDNNRTKAVIDGDMRKTVSNLILLFDVDTNSNWKQLVYSNGGGAIQDRTNALQTISQEHGDASIADIMASLLFLFAGLANLLVWGVFCGLLKLLSLAVASFVAVAAFLACLILAFAPDKGRKALGNSLIQLFAWVAGPTVIALFASVGCMFVNAGMGLLNIVGADGGTTGGILSLTLATMLLPVAYLMLVRYLCVKVWGLGDPFSLPGLAQLAGFGGAMKTGLAMGAGAIAGGAAALMAGGGALSALSTAGDVLASGGRGGLVSAIGRGTRNGRMDSWFDSKAGGRKSGNGGPGPDHGPSEADRAAAEQGTAPASETSETAGTGTGQAPESDGAPAGEAGGSENPADGEETTQAGSAPAGSGADAAAAGSGPVISADGQQLSEMAMKEEMRQAGLAQGLKGEELDAYVNRRMTAKLNQAGAYPEQSEFKPMAERFSDMGTAGVFDEMASGGRHVLRPVAWASHATGRSADRANGIGRAASSWTHGLAQSRIGRNAMGAAKTVGKVAKWAADHPNKAAVAALAIPGLGPAAAAAAIVAPRIMHSMGNRNGIVNRIGRAGASAGAAVGSAIAGKARHAAAVAGIGASRAAEWMSDKPVLSRLTSVNADDDRNIQRMQEEMKAEFGAATPEAAHAVLQAAAGTGWNGHMGDHPLTRESGVVRRVSDSMSGRQGALDGLPIPDKGDAKDSRVARMLDRFGGQGAGSRGRTGRMAGSTGGPKMPPTIPKAPWLPFAGPGARPETGKATSRDDIPTGGVFNMERPETRRMPRFAQGRAKGPEPAPRSRATSTRETGVPVIFDKATEAEERHAAEQLDEAMRNGTIANDPGIARFEREKGEAWEPPKDR